VLVGEMLVPDDEEHDAHGLVGLEAVRETLRIPRQRDRDAVHAVDPGVRDGDPFTDVRVDRSLALLDCLVDPLDDVFARVLDHHFREGAEQLFFRARRRVEHGARPQVAREALLYICRCGGTAGAMLCGHAEVLGGFSGPGDELSQQKDAVADVLDPLRLFPHLALDDERPRVAEIR
jgi:hypothetical protein